MTGEQIVLLLIDIRSIIFLRQEVFRFVLSSLLLIRIMYCIIHYFEIIVLEENPKEPTYFLIELLRHKSISEAYLTV